MNISIKDPINLIEPQNTEEIIVFTKKIISNQHAFQDELNKIGDKTPLQDFLISEYFFMFKQYSAVLKLLENTHTLDFDGVDLSISLIALTRTIIENMAIVNYLVHDKTYTDKVKSEEIEAFHKQGEVWLNSKPRLKKSGKHRLEILRQFTNDEYKAINAGLWGKLCPKNNLLIELIKSFKFTYPREYLIPCILFHKSTYQLKSLSINNELSNGIYKINDEYFQVIDSEVKKICLKKTLTLPIEFTAQGSFGLTPDNCNNYFNGFKYEINLYRIWDILSKFLHNNLLYTHLYKKST